jgi:hypothetical protein
VSVTLRNLTSLRDEMRSSSQAAFPPPPVQFSDLHGCSSSRDL